MRIGGNANGGLIKVSSDPDGTMTGQRGTLAIDTTTGVEWVNRDGSTRWDASFIPATWGWRLFNDFFDAASGSSIGGVSIGATSAAATPGVATLTVSAAGVDGFLLRQSTNTWNAGGGRYVYRVRVKLDNLSDGTNNTIVRAGPGDATTIADHTDGIYLEYDFATYGDHAWRLCAASGGTRTKTTTGIAPVANTWTTLEIRVSAAGTSVTAVIDNVAAPTPVTTNIPVTDASTLMTPGGFYVSKQLGATARIVRLDWLEYWQVLSVARGL